MANQLMGAGLGFRREMLQELRTLPQNTVNFFEIAPENWLGAGGRYARDLAEFTEQYAFACHGLSLSIGSTDPLDIDLLKRIKIFMQQHHIQLYTEHLSWCSHNGHLYDLLPIPCTEEAVKWVADRVNKAQDVLEMPIALENASYYFAPPTTEMDEAAFINAIVAEAQCFLHLDVNNIYVNSQNFQFDPLEYLQSLPLHRVNYIHVAGHFVEEDGLIIDTHGADVIDPVWALLESAYTLIGKNAETLPTCLERDFNFPALSKLLEEVNTIKAIQSRHLKAMAQRA